MPFEAEISHFGKATDSEIFHLERETMLVNDFGSIISALLMGDPKSEEKVQQNDSVIVIEEVVI